jgi:hypothetical protein
MLVFANSADTRKALMRENLMAQGSVFFGVSPAVLADISAQAPKISGLRHDTHA